MQVENFIASPPRQDLLKTESIVTSKKLDPILTGLLPRLSGPSRNVVSTPSLLLNCQSHRYSPDSAKTVDQSIQAFTRQPRGLFSRRTCLMLSQIAATSTGIRRGILHNSLVAAPARFQQITSRCYANYGEVSAGSYFLHCG